MKQKFTKLDCKNRPHTRTSSARRGSVLLVVLVIVALLTLAVYTFADFTLIEYEATTMYGRATQTRAYADSGIELAAALVTDPIERAAEDFYHRPELFSGVLLQDATSDRERGRCCVIAPNESDLTSTTVRYGLTDESGKLNLNAAVKWRLGEQEKRNLLMHLPEMTVEIADALFDWVDDDALQRQYGAESDFYEGLAEPYSAANGPLSSLDELLLVRDVTAEMLYGEDVNRNGLLDEGEDTNGDGSLQRGWSAYLTVYSRESNLRQDGTPRLFLNDDNLVQLYDALATEFDEDVARFVIAYRLNGAISQSSDNRRGGRGSRRRGSRSSGGSTPTASLDESSGNSPGVNTVEALPSGNGINKISSEPNSSPSGSGGSSGSGGIGTGNRITARRGSGKNRDSSGVKRGGLDLSGKPRAKINSLYDLVDAKVQAEVNGQNTELESPWKTDSRDLQGSLNLAFDVLTTNDADVIEGRVNINHAPVEVLLGLPNVTEQLAHAIASSRAVGSNGEPLTDLFDTHGTSAWLLMERLADVETMRQIDPYITTRGDVYRLQSVGYFDAGGPATRMEAVLDATEQPPRVVFFRDLTELGAGYSRTQLSTP